MNPNNQNPNTPDYNPYNDPEIFHNFLSQFAPPNPNQMFHPSPNQRLQSPPNQVFHQGFQGGFSQFTQGGFQSSQSQAHHDVDFVSHTHPERDITVPETQEARQKKKGKKKVEPTGTRSGPMPPKMWTTEEEVALAYCFIDHSENKTKDNSQKREKFWENVTKSWHTMMKQPDPNYRTVHQCTSKWKDLNIKLTKFGGIYNNMCNQRRSGMSDTDVLKAAENEYRLRSNGIKFAHYDAWKAVKDSPKWARLMLEASQSQGSSKRTKTSETNEYSPGMSDAHTNYAVDLEAEDDGEEEIPEPIRPIGREKAKRASSSSKQTASVEPPNNKLAEQLEEYTRFQREKLEQKKKIQAEKSLREDMKVLMMPDDHLDDAQREIIRKMKEKINEKYR